MLQMRCIATQECSKHCRVAGVVEGGPEPAACSTRALARIFHPPSAARPQVALWPRQTAQFDPQRINNTLPVELIVFLAREPLAAARDEVDEISGLAAGAIGPVLWCHHCRDRTCADIRGPSRWALHSEILPCHQEYIEQNMQLSSYSG